MKLFQVDSFTNEPFRGNPAGVCILTKPAPEPWMQSIAAEVNSPETAFTYKKDGEYQLRWFTPTCEVPLCGHATLATAHTLWEQGIEADGATLTFHTLSGPLRAKKIGNEIDLDLPASEIIEAELPEGLLSALGITEKPRFYGVKSDFDIAIIEVAEEATVRGLKPNFHELKKVEVNGAVVTARSQSGKYDFVSRVFVPRHGIDEDPVTGAAHVALGPYWGKLLGKTDMQAVQVSAREGRMGVRLDGERVHLRGQAITVFSFDLAVSATV